MKTKEQILEWLDKQPWKNEFYENYFKIKRFEPEYNQRFLLGIFSFNESSQGFDVWKSRNEEYQKWYNSNNKPMSWEEYCEQNPLTGSEYRISLLSRIMPQEVRANRNYIIDVNVMSKELCEAFVAYMKLIQLRNAWVKDCTDCVTFARITTIHNSLTIMVVGDNTNGLSFYSKDVAQEFIDTFKDLLETAKPLL